MHSVIGTGLAMGGEGFLHPVVAFAKPFRIPDFFILSGLFLGRVIDRDWRLFTDRRVVHFAYFYLLARDPVGGPIRQPRWRSRARAFAAHSATR